MGFFAIFEIIKELLGITKPYLDQDKKNKDATTQAIKTNNNSPPLSVDLNDSHENYKKELLIKPEYSRNPLEGKKDV